MKEYGSSDIRNVVLVGHQDTGKTSMAEAMLFTCKSIDRMGRVEDTNTTMDTSPEEHERKISIQAALAFCEHKDTKINLIDTPGYEDFVGEVVLALDVVEAAIMAVRGDGGVEVGTEKVWAYLRERNLPTLFCVNRMDKENASFDETLTELREHFGRKVVPLQIPIGQGESFKGVVDLLTAKAYEYDNGKAKSVDVPADLKDRVDASRNELFEAAAENDEALMEKYLESESLSLEDAIKGLSLGVRSGDLYPLVCVCAANSIGFDQLLDRIVDLVPSPAKVARTIEDDKELKADATAPPVAKIFKNVSESHVGDMLFVRVFQGAFKSGDDVYNSTRDAGDRLGQLFFLKGKNRVDAANLAAGDLGAAVKLKHAHVGDTLCQKSNIVKVPVTKFPKASIFSSISAATKGDEDKIGAGLNRLREEDPTFEVRVDQETHETLISGQGEMHLEILMGRLKNRFGVDVVLSKPKIPYKETIRKSAESQGKYKKQTGGRGQYGDVWLKLETLPRGTEFEFVNAIVGGVVPGKFIPAVEKGVLATMQEGVLAGCKVVDVKVTLYDGSYHNVDSSEQAFKVAAAMAFKKAYMSAAPVLLEPIFDVEVKVPEMFMGDVMGDMSGRRGKIQGMEPLGAFTVVRCQVPLAELYRYSTHLRSMTHGRGTHKRAFSHYEEVPRDQLEKVVEAAKKEKEQEA